LYDWLLKQDIKWFDPAAWAPHTTWKEEVTEASRTPLDSWVNQLWNDPDGKLPLPTVGKALFTARELATLYLGEAGEGSSDVTTSMLKSIGNALRNRGFKLANGGKNIRPPGEGANPTTYWIVRQREDDWSDSGRCVRHIKGR